jgi:hypothetical protein
LTVSVKELAINMKNMLEEQRLQGERIKRLEAEPANTWKNMKQTAFNTIVGVVAGALAVGLIVLIAHFIV